MGQIGCHRQKLVTPQLTYAITDVFKRYTRMLQLINHAVDGYGI